MIHSNPKSKFLEYITTDCHDCNGTGFNKIPAYKDKPCTWCNGTGKEEVTKYTFDHPEDKIYYEGMFMEEDALAELLKDGALFCNSREYLEPDFPWDKEKRKEGEERKLEIGGETIVLFLNCNDTFAWGCSDCECILLNEIEEIYVMSKLYKFGTTRWICLKRNQKPQAPLVKYLKDANEWDELMENLPDNYYDLKCKERYEKVLEENKGCLGI